MFHASLTGSRYRVSLAKVAKHAGVSTATVCRVLRQAELVRPETVSQVREAMRAIGFVPPPPRASGRHKAKGAAAVRPPRVVEECQRDCSMAVAMRACASAAVILSSKSSRRIAWTSGSSAG